LEQGVAPLGVVPPVERKPDKPAVRKDLRAPTNGKCVYLVNGSLCGDVAVTYMNHLHLCETHIISTRLLFGSTVRTAALQSAKIHPLDSFPGLCYIALLPDGSVKIGYSNTEQTLARRFKQLSWQYKAPVLPLAAIKGGFVAEAVLHDRFAAYRIPGIGERFYYSSELAEYIFGLDSDDRLRAQLVAA
jgi:hypothetical protein